ncbi:transmembrane protein 272 [Chanos chanos]|uniref:Transmembrane protein 272 n=1 Tax=Chanos chanos TaxID=29144 RepID=A0A6J2WXV0_CHACN|nr:transmembrane protein 272-like [Chanos chanos]
MEERSLLVNLRQTPKPSTPALIFLKLLGAALPVAEIVIGALYVNDCPVQKYIPVYLIVAGGFALALALLSCLPCSRESEDGSQSALSGLCTAWNSLISLFLFCWFITGNVWIYSVYQPSYVPNNVHYCNKTLYLFAFWTTTLVYILMGVAMAVGCCALFCLCVCSKIPLGGLDTDV